MQEHIWVKPENLADFNIYQYGREDCNPRHSYGPAVRDHYLLHFILRGKGVFSQGGKQYTVSQNQGFLICPDAITYYEADERDPWSYLWIGFNSSNAQNLLQQCGVREENPVFALEDGDKIRFYFDEMKQVNEKTLAGQLQLVGWFYLLLSQLRGSQRDEGRPAGSIYGAKKEYVQAAIEYIQRHFARRITVDEIARYIGLNRSYFGSVFRENTGMSPQEFLIHFRMQKACQLLQNHRLAIGDVARSVGYDDPLLFSKIFKKMQGMAPSDYRKTHYVPS